ncbi:DUF4362 domain-containing protein [Paenibacillus koleovorans]|uniref:DUF4362 domain-containing protein n=1 Tax=Paenibacillus koleovorans TaxID=121608 RepID=UPI000FD8A333|nr:DUF4362 domain-containing protein [Paenibacillus koleovorans]
MKLRYLYILLLTLIVMSACQSYSPQKAIENGDVVFGPGGPANYEKLDRFMEDFEHKRVSKLRITSYTEEGDPIIQDLNYNGATIKYQFDSSRDQYGGKQSGKQKTICQRMEKQASRSVEPLGDRYVLADCQQWIGTYNKEEQTIFVAFRTE